jgi:hypothetical protein
MSKNYYKMQNDYTGNDIDFRHYDEHRSEYFPSAQCYLNIWRRAQAFFHPDLPFYAHDSTFNRSLVSKVSVKFDYRYSSTLGSYATCMELKGTVAGKEFTEGCVAFVASNFVERR